MKLRQFGFLALIFSLAVPAATLRASAADRSGVISGYVRDASGTPQMGAVVLIAGASARHMTVFTDTNGFFSVNNLWPGVYSVRISAPSFLPAILEKVGVQPGGSLQLKVTLNTLLNAVNVGPRRSVDDQDGWKWTLRSVANRPVLRALDESVSSPEREDHQLKGSLSFIAGSAAQGYGSGADMSTGFSVERSVLSSDSVGLSGNVAYGDGLPVSFLRASYAHHLMDGSGPSMGLTVRRFAPSDPNLGNSTLQSVSLNATDDVRLADVLELKFGSQVETIQFLGRVTAFRPYASLDYHLSPNTILAYHYASTLPNDALEAGMENASSDISDSGPRLSVQNFSTQLEDAHHEELSLSRRFGRNSFQLAAYRDHVDNTALLGAGDVTAAGGYLLPDVYSGTFTYTGDTLDTRGMRLVLQRKFCSDLTATLDYAYGGALDLSKSQVELQEAQQWITTERRHALAAKLNGTLPGTHTRVIASYRWLDGPALTPVDMFNASPGQADPFLNLVIRQPIPTLGFLPGHIEALIDLRNLLAEGYVPVIGHDGQTVYLVQAARSVRGGVAISF